MWPFLAAGAGLGILKYSEDKNNESKDRKQAATTQRYSPWTGLQAGPVQRASLLGDVMGGAATGMSMGQNMQSAASADKLNGAYAAYLSGQNGSQMAQAPAAAPAAQSAPLFDFNQNSSSMPAWMTMNRPQNQKFAFDDNRIAAN